MTLEVMAVSRSPSAWTAAIRKTRPARFMAIESRRRAGAPRRGHQCTSAPSDQASAIVSVRLATGPQGYHAARERDADEATRGSAIKLAAEVASRLLTFATTALVGRGLGAADFGRYTQLSVYAVLLAELGELGLQNLASRALVAGTHSLRALVRARRLLLVLVAAVSLAVVPLAPALAERLGGEVPDGTALGLLVLWYALSGWGEFLGVALRCRGARRLEALLLLALRALGLVAAAAALALDGRLRGVAAALALSP